LTSWDVSSQIRRHMRDISTPSTSSLPRLITQRSQVQILSPLQHHRRSGARFFGSGPLSIAQREQNRVRKVSARVAETRTERYARAQIGHLGRFRGVSSGAIAQRSQVLILSPCDVVEFKCLIAEVAISLSGFCDRRNDRKPDLPASPPSVLIVFGPIQASPPITRRASIRIDFVHLSM
jgi:hypothetical protein